jgi:geranyl-CoA carboxylase alpha subunit
LIKATYGGGGRGIRLVEKEEEFEEALQTAQSEAKNAFGSAEVMVERYVTKARHIEIQVLADSYGNGLHLFERECSVQRRRQKVIEEAPSPVLSSETRMAMGEVALQLLAQIGYVSAGTIEFLVDDEERFYFLEMNTRLQVEHTVTEEITGLDLVAWQIKIANGDILDIEQTDLQISGHSIQARLYAEDPYRGYLPQSGPILQFLPEAIEGLRYDHCLHVWNSKKEISQQISTYYDPMIAKIISYGATRDVAIQRLCRALSKLRSFGIVTNQDFLQQILQNADFQRGDFDITWLEENEWHKSRIRYEHLALSAVLLALKDRIIRDELDFFFSRGTFDIKQKLQTFEDDEEVEYWVHIKPQVSTTNLRMQKNDFDITLSDSSNKELAKLQIHIAELSSSRVTFVCDGTRHHFDYFLEGTIVWILANGQTFLIQEPSPFVSARREEDSLDIFTSMLGRVVSVHVKLGDEVEKGTAICTIEAMKMEHQMRAKSDGILSEIFVNVGEQVQAGQLIGRLEEM